MLQASCSKYLLQFKFPAGTSRGVMLDKETWFIKIWNIENPTVFGIGECAVFKGLSVDDRPDYQEKLLECCKNINNREFINHLETWPSIRFGIESALLDLEHGGNRILFPSQFTQGQAGIPINGLIWMGGHAYMKDQVKKKLEAGFRCIKFKVGAIKPEEELDLLKALRKEYSQNDLTIRLDANGAFTKENVNQSLQQFAQYNIHSIEQPVKAGNLQLMEEVCKTSPIPVALDEELIGINHPEYKEKLLSKLRPAYIILKPALTGGFSGAEEWISLANKHNIGWWITSALESNIGLNAIAQWTYSLHVKTTQGLGTGSLFTNNIPSPLQIKGQELWYNGGSPWDFSRIQ